MLPTANFFLKFIPVVNTVPNLFLSCQTFPPSDIAPDIIPPSANTVIAPNIELAKVYNAYSPIEKFLIIKMPHTNPDS